MVTRAGEVRSAALPGIQLPLAGQNDRAARLVAAARQCAPSTLPRASRVSAGGRHRRRNPLFVNTEGLLTLDRSFPEMSAGGASGFLKNVLPRGDDRL